MKTVPGSSQVFATRLIGARNAKGWSQTELAHEIGAALRSVQNWEAGEFYPRGKVLRKLSAALGVTIPYLLSGSDKPVTDEKILHEAHAMSLRAKSHEYLDQLLDRCDTDQTKLGWVYQELRSKLPLNAAPLRATEKHR